jgi:serine/threonine protein kinase
MLQTEYQSVQEWITRAYHPGVRACVLQIREWYQGRYQVEEFVGAGHTSVVFKAIDTKLDRVTALKVWQTRQRGLEPAILLKEAKYLARAEHPQIVRVFDFGTEDVSDIPGLERTPDLPSWIMYTVPCGCSSWI